MVGMRDRFTAGGARAAHRDNMASAWGTSSSVTDEASKKKVCAAWMLGFCCCCGCHRCYLEHYCTGTAWFCTLGCLGLCQLYDLCWLDYLISRSDCDA